MVTKFLIGKIINKWRKRNVLGILYFKMVQCNVKNDLSFKLITNYFNADWNEIKIDYLNNIIFVN